MPVHRRKVHKYLGMSLEFSHKGQVFVTMHDYLDRIIKIYDAVKDKHDDVCVVRHDHSCCAVEGLRGAGDDLWARGYAAQDMVQEDGLELLDILITYSCRVVANVLLIGVALVKWLGSWRASAKLAISIKKFLSNDGML